MKSFLFDVKLFASIRVPAETEEEARRLLKTHVECADTNFGAWPNGDPILGEASVDDDWPELIEEDEDA